LHVYSDAERTESMLSVCEKYDLASINRSPLFMGMLTGKYTPETRFPEDDIRHDWDLKAGRFSEVLKRTDAIEHILTTSGRTPAQGALAWIWARSPRAIPIPGFRNQRQVKENIRAMEFGPLLQEEMGQIDHILGR
jgi:aryl-alcohol dehydrogenase-like predicted oxidoreductase